MQYPTSSYHARRSWHAALLLALSAFFCFPAWAQNSAAKVMAMSGQAKAIDAQERERTLEKGADLFAGDRIVTNESSLVQVRLNDGGYMSVRPNTEMVIDRFVLDEKDASKSSFLVSLLRGGFRSITGLIGRSNPNGYQIRAATATIGIRGTDHEPVLILDTPEGQAQGAPGLYDKVNDGETFIRNNGGILALRRGDIGFAPLNTEIPPQVLLKVPEFYKVDVKTDARDAKDGDDKADGGKRVGGLLRPSVAARREALSGGAATGGQTGSDSPAATNNSTTPPPTTRTAPTATGTGTTSGSGTASGTGTASGSGTTSGSSTPSGAGTTSGTSTPSGSGSGTTSSSTLTPEQKRIILQNNTSPTAPKTTAPR